MVSSPALTAVPPRATRRRADSSGSRCSERCCRPRSCCSGGPPFSLGLVGETVLGVPPGWVAFALATPVQVFLGREFYENSYTALVRNRTANMDVLIAMGSSTAYVYSVAVLVGLLAGSLYFDTAALILVFITLGNYLEARSKGQASEALRSSSNSKPTRQRSSARTAARKRFLSTRSGSATG